MTLPNVILFPHTMLPLYIFEKRYRQMLRDALTSHRMFSVAMQNPDRVRESPYRVAGLGLIRTSVGNRNGTSNLILQGLIRVKLSKVTQYRPYRVYSVQPIQTSKRYGNQVDELASELREVVQECLEEGVQFPSPLMKKIMGDIEGEQLQKLGNVSIGQVIEYLCGLEDAEQMADLISSTLLSRAEDRQTILETINLENRLRYLIQFLREQQNLDEIDDEDDEDDEEEDEDEDYFDSEEWDGEDEH